MVWWCAALLPGVCVLVAASATVSDSVAALNKPVTDSEDYLVKQVVWKRCHRKLTPACLKLSLVRTVEMMSKDSSFSLAPGVFFSSNLTETAPMPADLARSLSQEHASLDDLVSFALSRYMRSLTLNVNLADFFSGGNETIQNSVIDAFSGRGKGGLGGYGGIALVMGGSLASMMLAALAALAGKALMTSMLALMMAALAAMKGGGGGGGGEHKTYEVITKPIVSHVNTHSSEVQHDHGHHYHKRSLVEAEPYAAYSEQGDSGRQVLDKRSLAESQPYMVYSGEGQRDRRSVEELVEPAHKDKLKLSRLSQDELQRDKRSLSKQKSGLDESSETKDDSHKDSQKEDNKPNAKRDSAMLRSGKDVPHIKKNNIKEVHSKTDLGIKTKVSHQEDINHQLKTQHHLRHSGIRHENQNHPKPSNHETHRPEIMKSPEGERHVRGLEKGDISSTTDNHNLYLPPFRSLPKSQNLRVKRGLEYSDPSDSRIYHIYQNPNEYFPAKDHMTSGTRYRRQAVENYIIPLAFAG